MDHLINIRQMICPVLSILLQDSIPDQWSQVPSSTVIVLDVEGIPLVVREPDLIVTSFRVAARLAIASLVISSLVISSSLKISTSKLTLENGRLVENCSVTRMYQKEWQQQDDQPDGP